MKSEALPFSFCAMVPLEAGEALERFSQRWDAKYPAISPSWRMDWPRLTVFFEYGPEIRKVIYTTNAIESLNYSLRKLLKTRGVFPNEEVDDADPRLESRDQSVRHPVRPQGTGMNISYTVNLTPLCQDTARPVQRLHDSYSHRRSHRT